jgi:hypothetical protein
MNRPLVKNKKILKEFRGGVNTTPEGRRIIQAWKKTEDITIEL